LSSIPPILLNGNTHPHRWMKGLCPMTCTQKTSLKTLIILNGNEGQNFIYVHFNVAHSKNEKLNK
jgi:hypothetical protein